MTRSSLLAALASLAACGSPGGVPGEALHDPYTERLVMAPYPPEAPWPQVTDSHTREGVLLEWVPADQEPRKARDRLAQQTWFGRAQTPASEAAEDELRRISKACRSVETDGPSRATEDGNDVAYAEVACAGGSLVLLKVIRGHEALYLVRREFAAPPGAQERRAVDAYLADGVYLCPITGGIGRCARR